MTVRISEVCVFVSVRVCETGSYECKDLRGVCEALEACLVQIQPCYGSEGQAEPRPHCSTSYISQPAPPPTRFSCFVPLCTWASQNSQEKEVRIPNPGCRKRGGSAVPRWSWKKVTCKTELFIQKSVFPKPPCR